MKILVIGKTGQVARGLAERAGFHRGIDLATVGRNQADLEVEGAAARIIADARPDLVINAAAYTAVDQAEDEPDLAFRINADAPGEIAEAAAAAGAGLIHLSTDYVFDGTSDGPYSEGAATNPLGVYGRSKLAGEATVRAAYPAATIVRTAWVYSPFGRNFVTTMMALGGERERINVVDDQRGSPTSAIDLAEALLTLCARSAGAEGRTFHLAGSGAATWFQLASHVMAERERHSLPAAIVDPISTADWPTRAARPRNSVLDCSTIEQDFGIRLPDWRQSVAETVARIARTHAL